MGRKSLCSGLKMNTTTQTSALYSSSQHWLRRLTKHISTPGRSELNIIIVVNYSSKCVMHSKSPTFLYDGWLSEHGLYLVNWVLEAHYISDNFFDRHLLKTEYSKITGHIYSDLFELQLMIRKTHGNPWRAIGARTC